MLGLFRQDKASLNIHSSSSAHRTSRSATFVQLQPTARHGTPCARASPLEDGLGDDGDEDSSSDSRPKARTSPVYKPRRMQRIIDTRKAAPTPAHKLAATATSQADADPVRPPPISTTSSSQSKQQMFTSSSAAGTPATPQQQHNIKQRLPSSSPHQQASPTRQQVQQRPGAGAAAENDDDDVLEDSSDYLGEDEDEGEDPGLVASTSGRSGSGPALDLTGDVFFAPGQFVELGQIVGAHGIRGEVKIELSTDSPKKRLGVAGNLLLLRAPQAKGLLARSNSKAVPMLKMTTAGAKIRVLSKGVEAWIVQFKELNDRAQAEQLRGYTILMPLAARERLRDPDEFYAQDLVGCAAYDQASGIRVGTITDLFSGTGTFDTLSVQLRSTPDDIRGSKIRTTLVPFVADICPVVDLKAKRVELSAPEGLLDLSTTRKMRKALTAEQQAERLQALKEEMKAEATMLKQKEAAAAPVP